MTIHTRINEAVNRFGQETGTHPRKIYLGTMEKVELELEISQLTTIHDQSSPKGSRRMYRGLPVYVVDEQEHISAGL
jgi:hypothetical protein